MPQSVDLVTSVKDVLSKVQKAKEKLAAVQSERALLEKQLEEAVEKYRKDYGCPDFDKTKISEHMSLITSELSSLESKFVTLRSEFDALYSQQSATV